MDGFSKFKRQMFRIDKVITENCFRWKSTSGSDGKRFFVYKMRTNRRIFEIQTAFFQVWSKWWWKNVVTKNLLPVSTGKGFLVISWELIDGFSKFKRHIFRFDRGDDGKMLSLKSTSGFGGKRLFTYILRTNRRIFEIQTANFQVWS